MNKTSMFIIFLIITGTGILLSFTPGKASSDQQPDAGAVYADGVYHGEGRGFRPRLRVEVEILGGKIESVKVVSHNEVGPQYWRRAVRAIPKAVIKAQSTDVDVVGGATYTSRGIMDAVEDALTKAESKNSAM